MSFKISKSLGMTSVNLPLITLVTCSHPIVLLLLGGHGVPFLRFGIVSPSVIEVRSRVLYQLPATLALYIRETEENRG